MPAYHSKFNECVELQVGNMAVLPIKTNFKGPAPRKDDHSEDIIDEALLYFKPNIFFRQFEIKGSADRTLIYLMLYIIECLKRLQKGQKKTEAIKDLTTMALSSKLPIPGEVSFPFQETMRAYLQQLRQELGARLCERVFLIPDAPASKWWLCFARRRFMDKALSQTM
ncbi:ARP2/3 complex ARPC3 (21 kDa) subunit domain-containing protein [Ditylenchus destructor]|nr:ARP2/3 complex ARPC3 (21 kDa) subunit domain-containing protein [Ditylenchus destructor]